MNNKARINVQRIKKEDTLEEEEELYLREIVLNTTLLFGKLFSFAEEDKDEIMLLVCSTVEEIFNNLDPGYKWKIEHLAEEETE